MQLKVKIIFRCLISSCNPCFTFFCQKKKKAKNDEKSKTGKIIIINLEANEKVKSKKFKNFLFFFFVFSNVFAYFYFFTFSEFLSYDIFMILGVEEEVATLIVVSPKL
jgi:hypothetical protein